MTGVRAVLVALLLSIVAIPIPAGAIAGESGDSEGGDSWLIPVDADIVDPFRPPATRYSAGNRGIEFATEIGSPVRAVDAGRVVFAGVVGNARHVTIDHGNGLRSTSAYLESILVVRGQYVERGERIATTGPGFHLTARLGDTYVDPALLFAGAEVILALIEGDGLLVAARPLTTRDWGGMSLATFIDRLDDVGSLYEVVVRASEAGTRWKEQECDPSGDAPSRDGPAGDGPVGGRSPDVGAADHPGAGRTLIQVGGLGSSSDDASIGDLDVLGMGYDLNDILGFSYAGGCTPQPFGIEGAGAVSSGVSGLSAELAGSPYQALDTYADIEIAALRLADLVEAAALARPGQPIDVVAHSLGGVVARRALEILLERPGGVMPATVITIGSPHQGVNLADAAIAARPGSAAADALEQLGRAADVWDAVSVSQVATSGSAAIEPPTGVPEGVRVVSIGGATDVIVPLSSTWWEGATNVTVAADFGDAADLHGDLPGLAFVGDQVERAISGRPAGCSSLASHMVGVAQSTVIQQVEDLVALGVGILSVFE